MPPRKKVQNGGDPPGKDDAQAATLEKGDLAKGSITDYAQMQSDELEALRSIYMDDFTETETKPTAWSVSQQQVSPAVEEVINNHLRVAFAMFRMDVALFNCWRAKHRDSDRSSN